jgi:glycerophosphoryl diester phosphodiesterase
MESVIAPPAVRFAHAVNSRAQFASALEDARINILEADVILSRDGVAVMGHDPGTPSDLTLSSFLAEAHAAHRGVKADIKVWGAAHLVVDSLASLNERIGRVCC